MLYMNHTFSYTCLGQNYWLCLKCGSKDPGHPPPSPTDTYHLRVTNNALQLHGLLPIKYDPVDIVARQINMQMPLGCH